VTVQHRDKAARSELYARAFDTFYMHRQKDVLRMLVAKSHAVGGP